MKYLNALFGINAILMYANAAADQIDNSGTWKTQEDGSLKGDFRIRDQKRGMVRGRWTLFRNRIAPGPMTCCPGLSPGELRQRQSGRKSGQQRILPMRNQPAS